MLTPIYLDSDGHTTCITVGKIKILCTKSLASSEAMTSSTQFGHSYRQNVSRKFAKLQSVITSLVSIFIKLSLFCSKFFTLSSEINLKLVISPLRKHMISSCESIIHPSSYDRLDFHIPEWMTAQQIALKQGRIQDFHFLGGARAKDYVPARTLRAQNRTHFRQGSRARSRAPEALGLF